MAKRGLYDLVNADLMYLLGSQVIFVSAGAMTVTMAGIIGTQLAPTASLATLPVSLMVLGTALAAFPAARLMQKVGRRTGFVAAACVALLSCAMGFWGLQKASFSTYCLGTALLGISLAFSQQFRYAATETVAPERAGLAVSVLLMGSVGGAIVGPELVARAGYIFPGGELQGALLGAGILFSLAIPLLSRLSLTASGDADGSVAASGQLDVKTIHPLVWLAVAGGVLGQGLMTFVMTATPVSMHVLDGHTLVDTAAVVRIHVLAMYLPSLASGWLISRFGARALMALGVVVFLLTLLSALSGKTVAHYGLALLLLGVGWNFLFVGGTTLLVEAADPANRFQAQGYNDAAVFGSSALASFAAGAVLNQLGWQAVIISTLPPVLLLGCALVWLYHKPLPVHDAALR